MAPRSILNNWCENIGVPEDGAVFMKAVEAMVAAQNPPVTSDEVSARLSENTFPQKRVDALLALTEQAMSTMEEGLQPVHSADKYQVVIHLEHSNEHHCSIESGAHHLPLSPATAKRLCCDGGETRLDNLVLLCRYHHRLLHQEGYEIVKHGEQRFEFLTPAVTRWEGEKMDYDLAVGAMLRGRMRGSGTFMAFPPPPLP